MQDKAARDNESLQYCCTCSFLEIYNEHIRDLLDSSKQNLQVRSRLKLEKQLIHHRCWRESVVKTSRTRLTEVLDEQIREDAKRGQYVEDLTAVAVETADDVFQLLQQVIPSSFKCSV